MSQLDLEKVAAWRPDLVNRIYIPQTKTKTLKHPTASEREREKPLPVEESREERQPISIDFKRKRKFKLLLRCPNNLKVDIIPTRYGSHRAIHFIQRIA